MKLLITSRGFGQISDEPIKFLEQLGIKIIRQQGAFDEKLFDEQLQQCQALIIGAHPITAANMDRAKNLKLICKHGTGLDNIDLGAAKERGIWVTNAPGVNSQAVADLTFGLMLDIARKITFSANKAKEGFKGSIIGHDVYGKTLGLIGFGAIAKCVAMRAMGFNMHIFAYDPFLKNLPSEFANIELCSIDKIFELCDFISLHVPLNDSTKNLIDKNLISKMKKNAFFINTSRGGVVDELALFEALKSNQIAGAGLDVTEDEKIKKCLSELDNTVILPHIGMYSVESVNAISMICAQNVAALCNGGEIKNIVNT